MSPTHRSGTNRHVFVFPAAAWTKYHVAVTKQHDAEFKSHATEYDMYDPGNPLVSLDNYLDGKWS
jgi:hypothetical protein